MHCKCAQASSPAFLWQITAATRQNFYRKIFKMYMLNTLKSTWILFLANEYVGTRYYPKTITDSNIKWLRWRRHSISTLAFYSQVTYVGSQRTTRDFKQNWKNYFWVSTDKICLWDIWSNAKNGYKASLNENSSADDAVSVSAFQGFCFWMFFEVKA